MQKLLSLTRDLRTDERGQGTLEYVMVIFAAVALAVILVRLIQGDGGGSNWITNIIDAVTAFIPVL